MDVCHSGRCINEELCRKKLKVYCGCRHRKIEATCDKIRCGFKLPCDETCIMYESEQKRIAEQEELLKREREEEKNRKELLEYEKKIGKKKYKDKKLHITKETENSSIFKYIAIAIVLLALAILIHFWISFQ